MSRYRTCQAKLSNYVRTRYNRVYPQPTAGLFNYKCFFNAVEYAKNHEGIEVYECVMVEQGEPILHYVNYDNISGKYLETSIGHQAELNEYYVIRQVDPADYPHVSTEFERALESWTNQFTTWFDRKILRIGRIL